jgi:hypothetical protein
MKGSPTHTGNDAPPPTRDKPAAVDYAVMFGGPAVFLAIVYFGMTSLIGPPPPPNPVDRLREGAVRPGMTEGQVLRNVGRPKGIMDGSDGYTYRYQRSSWDPQRRLFVEEDAYVDFDDSGRVARISFDSRVPTPAGELE